MRTVFRRGDLEAGAAPVSMLKSADNNMEQLIGQIAKNLVDQPEAVQVTSVNGNQTMVVELKVAKEDVGKVIGKQGKTADAIRVLLSAAAAKNHQRTVFRILE